MTIIATDLDRTLIFSESFVAQNPTATHVCEVEPYDGRNVSLMAEEVRDSLALLAEHVTVVPTTTRTRGQLRRVRLGITPSYEICCSGAVLLRGGVPDPDWAAHVQAQVSLECLSHDDATRAFDTWLDRPWLRHLRDADGAFLVAGVEPSAFPQDELAALTETLVVGNWRVVHQGSKVYAIPRVVTKWAAVDHLRQELRDRVWAAGDSVLDWDLLAHASRSWTTRDGELAADGRTAEHLAVTRSTGLDASVEIVRDWCSLLLPEASTGLVVGAEQAAETTETTGPATESQH